MLLYKRLYAITLIVLIAAGIVLFSIYVQIDSTGEFRLTNTIQKEIAQKDTTQQETSKQIIQKETQQKQVLSIQEKKISSKVYYYGDDLVATKQSNIVTYYHQDYLGSTRAQSDTNKKRTSAVRTVPFGADAYDSSFTSAQNNYKFTGQERDETLYYYGARYYDTKTGRFLSVDPMIDTASPYRYADNNPLKFVDPTGMQIEMEDGLIDVGNGCRTNPGACTYPDSFAGPLPEGGIRGSEWLKFFRAAVYPDSFVGPLPEGDVYESEYDAHNEYTNKYYNDNVPIRKEYSFSRKVGLSVATGVLFPDTIIHEGSHALAALALGVEISSFDPYLHDGAMGSVSFTEDFSSESKFKRIAIAAAPYIVDFGVTRGMEELVRKNIIKPYTGFGAYHIGMHSFTSSTYFLNNVISGGDIDFISMETGIPRPVIALAGTAISGYLNARLLRTKTTGWEGSFSFDF